MKKQESKDITVQQFLKQALKSSDRNLNQVQVIRVILEYPRTTANVFYHRGEEIFNLEKLLQRRLSQISRSKVIQIILHFDKNQAGSEDIVINTDQLSVHHF